MVDKQNKECNDPNYLRLMGMLKQLKVLIAIQGIFGVVLWVFAIVFVDILAIKLILGLTGLFSYGSAVKSAVADIPAHEKRMEELKQLIFIREEADKKLKQLRGGREQ